MSVLVNTVLLLKSEKDIHVRDKYKVLLVEHNFEVIIVKTLVFHYQNIEGLREKLLKPDEFSGIILSSPRCVSAVGQALEKSLLHEHWNGKCNFTVGESTFHEARETLGIECKGQESGNALNLSQIIIERKNDFNRPFLFPHGNLKTDVLKTELGKENLKLEEVLVYETMPNPLISAELEECTNNFSVMPEFLVFFSPSGFHSSIEYLQKVPIDWNLIKIIAIGPVTKSAIENQNLKVHNVAANPTPKEILNALM